MNRLGLLLREAWIYSFRKGSRSVLLRLFLVTSVVLLLLTNAIASGIDKAIFNSQIYVDSGHVVLSWQRDKASEELSTGDRERVAEVTDRLAAAGLDPYTEYVRQLPGQFSNSRFTEFRLIGIDYAQERHMLQQGLNYQVEPTALGAGEAIISQRTADEYGLDVGRQAKFSYRDATGQTVRHPVRVVGIFENGAPWQESHIFVSQATFDSWLDLQRSDIRVKIFAASDEETQAAQDAAQIIISDTRSQLMSSTYLDEASQYKGFSETARTLFNSMNIIVVAVLFIGVQVLIILRLSQRRREFSVLRALGHRREDISALVVLEFFLLGAVSLAVGFVLAAITVQVVRWVGIPITSEVLRYLFGNSYLWPHIDWGDLLITFLVMLSLLVLSVLPHAFHGRRLLSQDLN